MIELSLASIAQLKILLVPVQPIRREVHSEHTALIKQFTKIPVRDVPTDPRGPAAPCTALPTSNGSLLFQYLEAYPRSQAYLEEFQLSRRVLGLIGVLDCSEWDDLQEGKLEFDRLVKQHPQVLATRLFAFHPSEAQQDDVEGLVVIPNVGDPNFYMATLMADFSASLLHGLSDLASAMDKRLAVEGPSETIIPDVLAPLNSRTSTSSIVRTSTPDASRRVSTPNPPDSIDGNSKRFSTIPDVSAMDKSNRRKMQGRVLKLKADLRTLAGRWSEATNLYNEAIVISKTTSDDVWHASAAENLIMLQAMSIWVSAKETIGPTGTKVDILQTHGVSTLRELPDRYATVLPLYSKSLTQITEDQETTPPLIYAEACLRAARVQLSAWRVGGWNAKALSLMMTTSGAPQPLLSDYARLSALSSIQRFSVAELASQAITKALETIVVTDRLAVLKALASLYSTLGYTRKRAVLLREIAALLSDGIRRARTTQASEAVVRSTPATEGNTAIVSLLEKVCEAYGVELIERLVVGSKEAANRRRQSVFGLSGDKVKSTVVSDEPDLVGRFGWPNLQVSIIRDAVYMAGMIAEHSAVLRFGVSGLRGLSSVMPPMEQYELSQSIPETFQAAARRGAEFELDFWGPPNFVMSIEVAPLPSNRHPHAVGSAQDLQTGAANPTSTFYSFDPKKEKRNTGLAQSVLVQNEPVDMLVTLQNTFMFDLHVESIELSTSGCSFEAHPISITLPSASYHTIHLTGTPLETGLLEVRGCKVRLQGSMQREFVLPSWASTSSADVRPVSVQLDEERIKEIGLSANKRLSMIESGNDSSELKYLQCKVLPCQPLLAIRSTSLTHGAMMLYDGERAEIQLQLENISSMSITYLDLSFQDAHSSAMLARLQDHEISLAPAAAYELDQDLRHRPVLSWQRPETDVRLEPGEQLLVKVDCLGKVQCNEVLIQISYGSLSDPEDTQLIRRLSCPVLMTVHHCLSAESMLLQHLRELPQQPTSSHAMKRTVTQNRQRAQSVSHIAVPLEASIRAVAAGRHCLLIMEVHNMSNQPFEAFCDARAGTAELEALSINQRIEPGATASLLVRLSRISLPSSQLSQKPIPAPEVTKQYVISDRQLSKEDRMLESELFWCREYVLNSIEVSWKEIGTRRHGQVSLRSLRLSEDMLDILKVPTIDIQVDLTSSEPSAVRSKGLQDHWQLRADEFVDLRIGISSTSNVAMVLQADVLIASVSSIDTEDEVLQPISSCPMVIFDGSQCLPVFGIEPAHSAPTSRSPICFLSKGIFRLAVIASESADKFNGAIARRDLVVHIRLMWHYELERLSDLSVLVSRLGFGYVHGTGR